MQIESVVGEDDFGDRPVLELLEVFLDRLARVGKEALAKLLDGDAFRGRPREEQVRTGERLALCARRWAS